MEIQHEKDLIRVNELLRHTGEFIAYFELAESKMIEWRDEIEQQSSRLHQQTQTIHHELTAVHELLSQAGTTRFRIIAEKALSQGESQLHIIENSCKQFSQNFLQQQEKMTQLTQDCIKKIEDHTAKVTLEIKDQLAKYDIAQFHRIANESCDHVERVANNAIHKSNRILNLFQLKACIYAACTSIIFAFLIVVYLSGESPWDVHQTAVKEREAGKALLHIWPQLSLEEKNRLFKNNELRHGG